MFEAVILVLTLVGLTFLGYISHWAFHQKWSGIFYRKHYTHHFILYPVDDFSSGRYRNPKKDNSVILFGFVFAPFILLALLLTIFQIIPTILGILVLFEMSIVGFVNNYLHDAFHLDNSFWHRFWFFERLKKLHYQHHVNTQTNFGIFSFSWDKILKTFDNGVIEK